MIRVGCLADSHFDARNDLVDSVRVHRAALAGMRTAQVDLILHAGDVYERASSPVEREAAADLVRSAAEIAPVVIVRGNHDAPRDIALLALLDTKHPVHVAEVAVTFALNVGGHAVQVHCLPWFDKAWAAAERDALASSRAGLLAAAGLEALLSSIGASVAAAPGTLHIGLGHVMIGGALASTGQTLIGQGLELAPSDLAALGCEYWVLGHIHKSQWFTGGVFYCGSPQRQNFGEPEDKGWWLLHLGPDAPPALFTRTPARRLERAELDLVADPGALERYLESADVRGGYVRLRYRVRSEALASIDLDLVERRLRDMGALEVKLEAVVERTAAVRSEAIGEAASDWDRFRVWGRASKIPAARLDALRERFATIEKEVRDAT